MTISDTNSISGLVSSATYIDTLGLVTPPDGPNTLVFSSPASGEINLAGSFGNYTSVSLALSANYDGSGFAAVSPPPPALSLNNAQRATDGTTNGSTDVLSVQITATPYSIPSGNPVLMTTALTGTLLNSSATLASTLTDSASNTTNSPMLSLANTFAGSVSNSVLATNNPGPFSLANTIVITTTTADTVNITGSVLVTAVVPEPSTMVMALTGGLIMTAAGVRRRKRG